MILGVSFPKSQTGESFLHHGDILFVLFPIAFYYLDARFKLNKILDLTVNLLILRELYIQCSKKMAYITIRDMQNTAARGYKLKMLSFHSLSDMYKKVPDIHELDKYTWNVQLLYHVHSYDFIHWKMLYLFYAILVSGNNTTSDVKLAQENIPCLLCVLG